MSNEKFSVGSIVHFNAAGQLEMLDVCQLVDTINTVINNGSC